MKSDTFYWIYEDVRGDIRLCTTFQCSMEGIPFPPSDLKRVITCMSQDGKRFSVKDMKVKA